MRRVGEELATRLEETVHALRLDDRALPMDRAHDEEEDLARLPIAAAWYQVNYRTSIGFAYTPLAIRCPSAIGCDCVATPRAAADSRARLRYSRGRARQVGGRTAGAQASMMTGMMRGLRR
ncbi:MULTISPECIES: hypothetical protein [unclassified Streptomyces]|uniref:hypothetical protein n=1 Tax=unclassified Streptomyces TaxID=2593676 RepID=UPI0033BDF337